MRNACKTCQVNAPSQIRSSPIPPVIPSTPFEAIVADYFDLEGQHYLVIGDRLSGWTETYQIKQGTEGSGSKGLCTALRRVFSTFGVPEELSSDGGPEFISKLTQDFLDRWGVRHRRSSAYFAQSNGRAELAVKTTKRLLRENTGNGGSLDTDAFVQAQMTHRNTPDPDCRLSPSEILFGHKLRDAMPRLDKTISKLANKKFLPMWREAWVSKENALRTRYAKSMEKLQEHSKHLPPLQASDKVMVQNQAGPHPKKWDRSGTVVEIKGNDQYGIKIDGTGRITPQNRRFVKKFIPVNLDTRALPSNEERRMSNVRNVYPENQAPDQPGQSKQMRSLNVKFQSVIISNQRNQFIF
jgi:hypothetical protein